MTQEQIKKACEYNYKMIKDANENLEAIRNMCQHPNTHEGLWSWRLGCIDPGIICSDCGTLVKIIHPDILHVLQQIP